MPREKENYRVEAKDKAGAESGVSLLPNQKEAFRYAAYLMRQGKTVLIIPPAKLHGAE